MVSELYVSFVLTKEEMERNGVTSHQIIKFSHSRDPKIPAFIRLLNVFERDLSIGLDETLRNESDVICLRSIAPYYDYQWLVKVFPREDIDMESGKLMFLTAQDRAFNILIKVFNTLKCDVIQELPDLVAWCPDVPSTWTMKVKAFEEKFLIEVQKFTADYCYERDVAIAKLVGVELKSILFCLLHWHDDLEMRRLDDLSLDPVRNIETFTCNKINKTSDQIVYELKVKIELFSGIRC